MTMTTFDERVLLGVAGRLAAAHINLNGVMSTDTAIDEAKRLILAVRTDPQVTNVTSDGQAAVRQNTGLKREQEMREVIENILVSAGYHLNHRVEWEAPSLIEQLSVLANKLSKITCMTLGEMETIQEQIDIIKEGWDRD